MANPAHRDPTHTQVRGFEIICPFFEPSGTYKPRFAKSYRVKGLSRLDHGQITVARDLGHRRSPRRVVFSDPRSWTGDYREPNHGNFVTCNTLKVVDGAMNLGTAPRSRPFTRHFTARSSKYFAIGTSRSSGRLALSDMEFRSSRGPDRSEPPSTCARLHPWKYSASQQI